MTHLHPHSIIYPSSFEMWRQKVGTSLPPHIQHTFRELWSSFKATSQNIIGIVFMAFAVTLLMSPLHSEAAGQDYSKHEAFIKNLGNNVISILVKKKTPLSSRKASFRKEIKDNFALQSIGRFIIARYWRRMDETQKKDYLKLFENAVIENYASQFNDYSNQKLIVKSSRGTKDGGVVVKSDIRRPGKGEPLHINWKVFNTKRGFKVLDVIVNNVSMSITLRNEYASAVQNRGGIDGLLDYLREKIKEDRERQ